MSDASTPPVDTSVSASVPRVAIWRSTWLPGSETFIRNQVDTMKRWMPVPVGIRRRESPLARATDTVLFGTGRIDVQRGKLFELTSRSSRVRRYLKRGRFELVHAHFGGNGMVIAQEARRAGLPLVVTLHGSDITEATSAPGLLGRRYRWRIRRMMHGATTVIAVSDFIRGRAIEHGAPPERTVVHHIGIRIPDVSVHEENRSGLLFVGRLVEKKGVEDLIRAVALLPEELRDHRVTVVGNGPLREQLAALAESLGIRVDFVGSKTPDEVASLMRTSAIYCAPSKVAASGDTEGLPTVVMEAGAAGTPVVGYIHAGIPDVVTDGETGLLVTEGDVEALAAGIRELLLDPERAREMGRAARERVAAHFDMVKQTALLEEIYDRGRKGWPRG